LLANHGVIITAPTVADAFLRGFSLPAGTVLPSPAALSMPA